MVFPRWDLEHAVLAKQKKIFELAKELGVDSKTIIEKCHAEGVSKDLVKTHMSPIGPGLEASVRDWFTLAAPEAAHTAIETASKVDLEHIKRPVARKKASGKSDSESTGGDTAIAVMEPVPTTDNAAAAASPGPEGHNAPATQFLPTPATIAPQAAAPPPATPTASELDQPPAQAEAPASTTEKFRDAAGDAVEPKPLPKPVLVRPTPPTAGPTSSQQAEGPGNEGAAEAATETDSGETSPDGSADPHSGSRPGHRGDDGQASRTGGSTTMPHHRPGATGRPAHRPATMNVPTRPTVVAPAGQRMGVPTAAKMAGPKVVRVEAPEPDQAPRPRRPMGAGGPPGSTGPRGPRPPGTGSSTTTDDSSRSPRRKPGMGASTGPGTSAAAAAAKRSSGVGVPPRRRANSGEEWVGGQIFSEQDMIEREARLLKAGGFLKKRKQDLSKGNATGERAPTAAEVGGIVRIAAPFTIKDLSAATGIKGADIVKKLFLQSVMANINSGIDPNKAAEIMLDFDIELEVVEAKSAEEVVSADFEKRESSDLRSRGPVVTILGHVDHGKTSLLDKIRNANVAAGEAGGITQKTSAFVAEVEVEDVKKQVVFLDTPGHEAFTSMRARGAKMTDVVVLVVSAPEGVMPQTIESISHAKAAKVPIVVALNKIDRPDATDGQVQKTLGELAKAGLNPVEWGGDTEVIRTSATSGQGIKELLETLDYQAQLLDLKADFGGAAQGTVIEAKVEEGRGAVANLLMQQGQLKVGDFIVMGRSFGRVRDITDDKGKRIKIATPPTPVQVSGIDEVCDAGDKFYVVDSLKKAQEAAEQRRSRERQTTLAQPKLTLDNLFNQMSVASGESEVKEIKIVLKTDQQGTVDVLKAECEKVKTAEVKVRVLEAAVGGITESNVLLADASRAIIIGFNVIPSGKARALAEQKGVEIRTYQVIYDITDDLKKAAEGMLAPELREEILGHADVRQVFRISKVGAIAGCYVTDGTVQRDALIRVTRNGVVIESDRKLAQLKRVKDDAKEVRAGLECGMKIDGYDDIKEGDVLECYRKTEVKRTL